MLLLLTIGFIWLLVYLIKDASVHNNAYYERVRKTNEYLAQTYRPTQPFPENVEKQDDNAEVVAEEIPVFHHHYAHYVEDEEEQQRREYYYDLEEERERQREEEEREREEEARARKEKEDYEYQLWYLW